MFTCGVFKCCIKRMEMVLLCPYRKKTGWILLERKTLALDGTGIGQMQLFLCSSRCNIHLLPFPIEEILLLFRCLFLAEEWIGEVPFT